MSEHFDPVAGCRCLIPLTRGQFAIVDSDDYAEIAAYKWYASNHFGKQEKYYAVRNYKNSEGKRSQIYMHRLILECKLGDITDHINGDSLDNRRSNLRKATPSQNMANRASVSKFGFRGVMFSARRMKTKKFVALISVNRKRSYLGRFATPEEAARAYDAAAKIAFGEHARLNFPEER